MFLANKLNKGGSLSSPDAQFNYVTMLLHGDGTNGAQNNTFVDSSTNNFTITRNGNTTQGSFSPYGSNWSNYFNGTDAVLSFPSSSNFAFGTGSFTIEFWINGPLNNDKFILGGRDAIGGMHITTGGSSSTAGVLRYVGTSTIVSSNVITDNTWHHCAIVRNGSSNITLYVDGVSVGTGTDTNNYAAASGTWYIARNDLGASNFLTGYLSNLRIVKGTAVYTSAFTPSTTSLTAISGTSLLTCQSNRFVDNSASPVTITSTATSVQRFNPFGTSTAYSTSVIGGSGYFDGSGDGLTSASSSSLDPSATNITVDFWFYPPSVGVNKILFACGTGATGNIQCLFDSTNGVRFQISGVSGSLNTNYKLNQWNYVVCVKNGTSFTVYVNNVAGNTATLTATSSTTVSIGSNSNTSDPYTGYIAGFRYVTGAATTPSSFPTAPPTTTVGSGTVQLLTNFTNGAIFDNAMMNDLETVGNAQISTSVVKYGTGSIYFDGTGDGLFTPSTPNLAFGTGDFTVEFWLYLASTLNAFAKVVMLGTTGNCFTIEAQGTVNVLNITNKTSTVYFASSTALTTGTWIHVAATRASGTLRLFQNGTQVGSAANTVDFPNAGGIYIGRSESGQETNGYIDDLRITKGYARYTANFTAPTAALSDTGPI